MELRLVADMARRTQGQWVLRSLYLWVGIHYLFALAVSGSEGVDGAEREG
jgi:hypothetical protein